jgi:dTDP-4-dehydrorhamnose reductase
MFGLTPAPRETFDNSHFKAVKLPDSWKVLVTGVTSIHGWPIFRQLQTLLPEQRLFGVKPPKANLPALGNVASFCITDRARLEQIKADFQPTHVIHCAGVCDLDLCEERPAWAQALNVDGSRVMAEVFGQDCPIIYMSTDLVFSGANPPASGYTEEHGPDPISVAGKTFAQAEEEIQQCKHCCIVRLGLPLGDSINGEKGAIDWIESRFRRKLPVTLFYDEYRSCMPCPEIGSMALCVLTQELKGLFHFGGDKSWSLHEIGQHVLQRGPYPPPLLKGLMRHQEENGPPRIGDVSLNSTKLKTLIRA